MVSSSSYEIAPIDSSVNWQTTPAVTTQSYYAADFAGQVDQIVNASAMDVPQFLVEDEDVQDHMAMLDQHAAEVEAALEAEEELAAEELADLDDLDEYGDEEHHIQE